jgi:hypothetical protein
MARRTNMPLMGGNRSPGVREEVKQQLRDLARDQCAFCHRSLYVIPPGTDDRIYIGEIAHIYPSSPGGERGDQERPADVNATGNLVPLCRNCHRTVDAPNGVGGKTWTIDKLRRLKTEHEAWIALWAARPDPVAEEPVAVLDVRPGTAVKADGQSFRLPARAGLDPRAGAARPERLDQYFAEQWSPDGDAVRCACYAYAETGDGGHAWLRRVAARPGSGVGDRWRQELADEVTLLSGGLPDLPGLPRLRAVGPGAAEFVAVTGLPTAATVADRFGDSGTAEEAVRALFAGLPQLCQALGALHDAGLAHGALNATSIVVDKRGGLVLRDLGRATSEEGDSSGAVGPGASDLWSGGFEGGGRPSKRDDVAALAALVYRLVTGFPPLIGKDGPPVLASTHNTAVPDRAAHALTEALTGGIRDSRALARRLARIERRGPASRGGGTARRASRARPKT